MIAGEIGSGPAGYTAVGEQVGMAQRMESAARPVGSCSVSPPRCWWRTSPSSATGAGANQGFGDCGAGASAGRERRPRNAQATGADAGGTHLGIEHHRRDFGSVDQRQWLCGRRGRAAWHRQRAAPSARRCSWPSVAGWMRSPRTANRTPATCPFSRSRDYCTWCSGSVTSRPRCAGAGPRPHP